MSSQSLHPFRESIQLLDNNEKGAWAEAHAIQWLIERNFWVFRNVAHLSPFDIIAVRKDGLTLLLDVKYIGSKPRKNRDPFTVRVLSEQQKFLGVRLFYVASNGEVTIRPEIENEIEKN